MIKALDVAWVFIVIALIGVWALYKIGIDMTLSSVLSAIPMVLIFLIPVIGLILLSNTEISINEKGITQKTFWKEKRIKWEDVTSMVKKHYYTWEPDFAEPENIEIKDGNRNAICVYRFLHQLKQAEKDILRYSKRPKDRPWDEEVFVPSWRKVFTSGVVSILIAASLRYATKLGTPSHSSGNGDGSFSSQILNHLMGVDAVVVAFGLIGVFLIFYALRMRRKRVESKT